MGENEGGHHPVSCGPEHRSFRIDWGFLIDYYCKIKVLHGNTFPRRKLNFTLSKSVKINEKLLQLKMNPREKSQGKLKQHEGDLYILIRGKWERGFVIHMQNQ